MVKLVRFTPTANVTSAQPNDVVRFMLQGNGFLDPYSTYIKFEIDLFPNRDSSTVFNASGEEMKASELYEACQESQNAQISSRTSSKFDNTADNQKETIVARGKFLDRSAHSFINRLLIKSQSTELERIEQYDVMAAMINDVIYSPEQKAIHFQEGYPTKQYSLNSNNLVFPMSFDSPSPILRDIGDVGSYTYLRSKGQPGPIPVTFTQDSGNEIGTIASTAASTMITYTSASSRFTQPSFETSVDGISKANIGHKSPPSFTFCIPMYSGLLGVLMPDKKLIPLSLMPLELEFGLNPHALYTMDTIGAAAAKIPKPYDRSYRIINFEIYGHMLMFEQEVHRAMEQVTGDQGVFIHFNSFYLAPITVNQGTSQSSLNKYAQINIHFKSINSIHFVFIYAGFENQSTQRKLNFVSHNLTDLQIRNGVDLIPSEPIRGDMSQGDRGLQSQFYMETLKGWNKMHDPRTDAAFTNSNYARDNVSRQAIYSSQTLEGFAIKQSILGRTQYAISLEGEELGKDRTTVSGKKGQIPFDVMQTGTKPNERNSYQIIFVKCDFVAFVRPDLVVTLLGR